MDAVVAWLPFPTEQLHVTVLYDTPRVVVVPLDHRLASKESVTLDDIADEPLPRVRKSAPAWSAFWRIDPRLDQDIVTSSLHSADSLLTLEPCCQAADLPGLHPAGADLLIRACGGKRYRW